MAHAAEMTAALDDEDFPIQIPQKLAPPQVQEGPLVEGWQSCRSFLTNPLCCKVLTLCSVCSVSVAVWRANS